MNETAGSSKSTFFLNHSQVQWGNGYLMVSNKRDKNNGWKFLIQMNISLSSPRVI